MFPKLSMFIVSAVLSSLRLSYQLSFEVIIKAKSMPK